MATRVKSASTGASPAFADDMWRRVDLMLADPARASTLARIDTLLGGKAGAMLKPRVRKAAKKSVRKKK
jgi:hypothetical protein